jgi:hypothetical protein
MAAGEAETAQGNIQDWIELLVFLQFLNKSSTAIFLYLRVFPSVSVAHIITFSICLCSKIFLPSGHVLLR